jgi:hypothetical protein
MKEDDINRWERTVVVRVKKKISIKEEANGWRRRTRTHKKMAIKNMSNINN